MAMTVGVRMEIRNEHLSITSKKHHRFSRRAGISVAAWLGGGGEGGRSEWCGRPGRQSPTEGKINFLNKKFDLQQSRIFKLQRSLGHPDCRAVRKVFG